MRPRSRWYRPVRGRAFPASRTCGSTRSRSDWTRSAARNPDSGQRLMSAAASTIVGSSPVAGVRRVKRQSGIKPCPLMSDESRGATQMSGRWPHCAVLAVSVVEHLHIGRPAGRFRFGTPEAGGRDRNRSSRCSSASYTDRHRRTQRSPVSSSDPDFGDGDQAHTMPDRWQAALSMPLRRPQTSESASEVGKPRQWHRGFHA